MINMFKSCFCPQKPTQSIHNADAFIPIVPNILNPIVDNSKTLKTENLSPEKKRGKIADIFTDIPAEINMNAISPIGSMITSDTQSQNTQGSQRKEQMRQKLIDALKKQECMTFIKTPKEGGNQAPIIQAHQDKLKEIDNMSYSDAVKAYEKLQKEDILEKK